MSILNTVSKQFFRNFVRRNSLKFYRFRFMSSNEKNGNLGKLINDDVTSAFLLPLNSEMARVEYEKKNGILNLYHTEIPVHYRNQGHGEILAKEVFDYCLERNLKIKLSCDFLESFYVKNRRPEYEDLVVR